MIKIIDWQKIKITLAEHKDFKESFTYFIQKGLKMNYKWAKFFDNNWNLVWKWEIYENYYRKYCIEWMAY